MGYNSRLDELQAALMRPKLARLDGWNRQRQSIAALYDRGLAGCPGLTLPFVPEGSEPVWHLYVVRHARRVELQAALARARIQTLIHYPVPPHLQPAYAAMNLAAGTFPITERIHRECLSLPMGPTLSPAQAQRVVDEVRKFCGA
jgi:dTDP-4-amino-4,6-dideoxygalactose transaminase